MSPSSGISIGTTSSAAAMLESEWQPQSRSYGLTLLYFVDPPIVISLVVNKITK